MSTLTILCSGQGRQGRGMFDLIAEAQEVFAATAAALGGRDPRDVAAAGNAGELHANATAQVLCCAQSLAAWGMAGAVEPAAAFDIVAKRAALMDAATPLLRGAAEGFGSVLRRLDGVRAPAARLLSGIDGSAVLDVDAGLDKLARQVAQMVAWAACMDARRASGATRAIELGPGDALVRMMGGAIGERDSRSMSEFRSLAGFIRWASS